MKTENNRVVVFEAARGRQGLVSAGDPCNASDVKSLPERVAHALLPKTKSGGSLSGHPLILSPF